MKRKIKSVLFFCIFFASILNAQEKIVVSVDGFFTNKDSNDVVNHLGESFMILSQKVCKAQNFIFD